MSIIAATTEDEIKTAMIALAKDVAKKASEDTMVLTDKIDALKTLATVYGILKKHKNDDPDDAQGDEFNFQRGVAPEEPAGNVSKIPTRRRPG